MDTFQAQQLLDHQQAIRDRLDAAGIVMANMHMAIVVMCAILGLLCVVELVKRWTV